MIRTSKGVGRLQLLHPLNTSDHNGKQVFNLIRLFANLVSTYFSVWVTNQRTPSVFNTGVTLATHFSTWLISNSLLSQQK